jgi:hypothetical protein
MSDDLLDRARQQAERSDPSVRVAALLRIARVESVSDSAHARQTLNQALEEARALSDSSRRFLLEEARIISAAVAPERLPELPLDNRGPMERYNSGVIVHTMLQHGHLDAAVDYLLRHHDPATFPFNFVGNVLHALDDKTPRNIERRLTVFRRTVDAWRTSPPAHDRDHFIFLFGLFWKQLPTNEALDIAHEIVDHARHNPDGRTSSGYPDNIHFSSAPQHRFFEILHVLRHLEPTLAQSLIDSNDQLAVAARRFPNGLETMRAESEAEAQRRKASGETCGGGYIMSGDSRDRDYQRALIDASRNGDFAASIDHALDTYREDASPDAPNYAPKQDWPSTGRFRSILYSAGKGLGPPAAGLLGKIPDPDLLLFAQIELAAALAGLPQPFIVQRRNPNPPGAPRGRISRVGAPAAHDGPTMCSPDGRLIRCPKCSFLPPPSCRWNCKCGHTWNTFWTSGLCPSCRFQWEKTMCPSCAEMSPHQAWYASS